MSDIHIFDSRTGKKEKFVPIDEKNIRLYVCGPTVYDDIHIGNARPLIIFDVMCRLLKLQYGAGHVKYVRNITDIDDKIIQRAKERNIAPEELTAETITAFSQVATALHCMADVEPRASHHIEDMVAMIEKLLAKDFAYQAEGHVLFEIGKMPDYGKFAKKPLDDLIAGARVEVASYKKSPLDFVLWKPAKADEWAFPSPWGMGRPGWHIECSAMAAKELGEHFDIHGGGQDLIFPHHENELAQSNACGHRFANYWMHNGFVLIDGKKMSKSAGNFVTVRDLLEKRKISPTALRLLMLSTHYRQPLDFTEKKLAEAQAVADKLDRAFRSRSYKENLSSKDKDMIKNKIITILGDDLNTIDMLEEMHIAIKGFNKDKKDVDIYFLSQVAEIFGLATSATTPIIHNDSAIGSIFYNKHSKQHDSILKIQELAIERYLARENKDFTAADELRDKIASLGYVVNDLPDKTMNIVEKSLLNKGA